MPIFSSSMSARVQWLLETHINNYASACEISCCVSCRTSRITMNVVNYLKSNSLDKLKTEHSIKVNEYPEHGLIVLNYANIRPLKDSVSKECRGLILSSDYKVISRAFDRFFNYNEMFNGWCNEGDCYAAEKIDGSLIKIYKFNGKWYISTRGTAFAECTVGRSKTTYKQAVYEALSIAGTANDTAEHIDGKFQQFCHDCNMNDKYTYILELTGKDNCIVTEYNPDKYDLWLLGIRCNDLDGEYIDVNTMEMHEKIRRPRVYTFKNVAECIDQANQLRELQEGFVIYNRTTGAPVLKIKSPRYVRIHNAVFSKTLSIRDICKMIAGGEWTEFVAYFPMHADQVNEHFEIIRQYFSNAQTEFEELRKTMQSDNDFNVFDKKPWKRLAVTTIKSNQTNLYDRFMNIDNQRNKLKYLLNEVFKVGKKQE